MTNLVEAFNSIVDVYYQGCQDWIRVENALANYEKIIEELKRENLPQHSIAVIRIIMGMEWD